MPGTASLAGQKRKAVATNGGSTTVDRKRQKIYEARSIPSQRADKALSTSGEMNLNTFVQTREFEINALDRSMRKARSSLMSRAFQQVPRHLRRRTASHNAKKVPRRLRRRAEREMKEDNTPAVTSRTRNPTSRLRLRLQNAKVLKRWNLNGRSRRQKSKEAKSNARESDPSKHVTITRVPKIKKNTLATPPTATVKFKRRQLNKTWLPTHLWHTKRAHMTRPVEPLWRMAIPMTPTEKCYRSSHRAASSRGVIAWDVSYMCTIRCLGTDHALENLLKGMGFHGDGWSGPRYRKWKAGTRYEASWIHKIADSDAMMAPILVIWAPDVRGDIAATISAREDKSDMTHDKSPKPKIKLDRQILIRIHPSAFHEFWLALLSVAKSQKPQVLVEDLRFEIGSIDVTGPGSIEALQGILKPSNSSSLSAQTWTKLGGVANPTSLPINALIALMIEDPRLNQPIKLGQTSTNPIPDTDLLETLTNWPLDTDSTIPALFSRRLRHFASKMPSQKAINRQKATATEPIPAGARKVSIPIILLSQRPDRGQNALQGTWTIMAPWKCIDPIWRSFMYYPLSSGGTPRFGGLQEKRQVAFEHCCPWFPGDSPGSQAGKAWERTQAEKRFDAWVRKPPSRRLAYHSIDLGLGRRGEVGRGWASDWEYLLQDTTKSQSEKNTQAATELITQLPLTQKTPLTQRQRKAAKADHMSNSEKTGPTRNTSSPESEIADEEQIPTIEYGQMSSAKAKLLLLKLQPTLLPSLPALVTIKITVLTKGAPRVSARIYRLPKPLLPTMATCELSDVGRQETNTSHDDDTSNSTPPAAQASPPTLTPSIASGKENSSMDLRARWLSLYQSLSLTEISSPNLVHDSQLRTNHHSLPRKASHYPTPDLRNVVVLPPNAPKEVAEQYGPKPRLEAELRSAREHSLRVRQNEESVWDSHIPCPDPEDLIGFVTSGGYNLSPGRGTAIGSIWIQKLVTGWVEENANMEKSPQRIVSQKATTIQLRGRKLQQKRIDRERHLCVVRNAGESVARLALWEICE